MPEFVIPMLELHLDSPRDRDARTELAAVLPDARVEVADPQTGAFDITLSADDLDGALTQVWDAVAASGTDDHIAFLEHADLPGHWRARSRKTPD